MEFPEYKGSKENKQEKQLNFLKEDRRTNYPDSTVSRIDQISNPTELTRNVLNTKDQVRNKRYTHLRMSELGESCPREWVLGYTLRKTTQARVQFSMATMLDMGTALHFWLQNYSPYFKGGLLGYWRCYDDQTEVLTRTGFKFFKDVTLDDEIATKNPISGDLEYYRPCAKQEYYYNGNMLHFTDSRLISLVVTPDHNMYIGKRHNEKGNSFSFMSAKSLLNRQDFRFCKESGWRGTLTSFCLPDYYLPFRKNVKLHASYEVYLPDYVRFMGWYLSEGNIVATQSRIDINQHKNISYRKEIEILVSGLSKKYYVSKKGIHFYSPQWVAYLKQFGKVTNKYIPRNIKELPVKYLKLFLDSYIKGDGTICKGKTSIYTVSPQMRDDLQEIIQKCGWSSSYNEDNRSLRGIIRGKRSGPVFHITINKNKLYPLYSKTHGNKIKVKPYSGMVYDLTVPNHVMLIRRKGKLVFSGNCQACGSLRRFGIRPTENCEFCNARPQATTYEEYMFRNTNPFRVVGKVDGIVKIGNVHRFIDIKSAGKPVEAPIKKDIIQLTGLMHFHQFDDGPMKLPIEIDRSCGYLIYFHKTFNFRNPATVFDIKPDKSMIELVSDKARAFTEGADNGRLPVMLNQCLSSQWTCSRAKGCPMLAVCKEFEHIPNVYEHYGPEWIKEMPKYIPINHEEEKPQ